MHNRFIAGAIVMTSLLFAATAEAKHGRMMTVELVKSQRVKMANGVKANVYLVKMHGEMMVGIPVDKLPADLQRQICARNYCRM